MMNIGITGTRFGLTPNQAQIFRSILSALDGTLHHGDCVGSDAECHDIARELSWQIVIHPATGDTSRANKVADVFEIPSGHLSRNRNIVADSDMIIALPGSSTETPRSGTWYTIRHAMNTNTRLQVILPDGQVLQVEQIVDRLLPGRWGK